MYHIRVMYREKVGGKEVEKEHNFDCPNYEITKIPLGHPFTQIPNQFTGEPTEVGLYFTTGHGSTIKSIHLPKDGHTIFVMNAGGQTIHTYRWPLTDADKGA